MAKPEKRCRGPNLGYHDMFVLKSRELPLRHTLCKGDIVSPSLRRRAGRIARRWERRKFLRARCLACGTFVGKKAWAAIQEDIDQGRLTPDTRIETYLDKKVFPEIEEERGITEVYLIAPQAEEACDPVPPQPVLGGGSAVTTGLESGRVTTPEGGSPTVARRIVEQSASGMTYKEIAAYHSLSPTYVSGVLVANNRSLRPPEERLPKSPTTVPAEDGYASRHERYLRKKRAETLRKVPGIINGPRCRVLDAERETVEAADEAVETIYADTDEDGMTHWPRPAPLEAALSEPENVTLVKGKLRVTLPTKLLTSAALAELQEGIAGLSETDGAPLIRYLATHAVKRSQQERGEITSTFADSSKAFTKISKDLRDAGYFSDLMDASGSTGPYDECDPD